MSTVIPVLNEYDYPQWYVVQTVALMEYAPVGTWHIAAVEMWDTETNCKVRAFGGGA